MPDKIKTGLLSSIEVPTDTKRLLGFFKYDAADPKLEGPANLCSILAVEIHDSVPDGSEKAAGMRKLLEAMDCFVRAMSE